ncbi:MAG TPA: sulfurtransferase [Blastocatellia bacterium]|jgi:thiosulfate/3-mercaptopyruvate sulfurtransferase|nr:sulfurtransferase [Blastocatellia bacterium]
MGSPRLRYLIVAISLILAALLCLPALIFAKGKAQAGKPAQSRVRSEMLVSTDWLAKHLDDRDVLVIHVAAERKHFDDGHIPGARYLSSKEILTTRNGVANELPTVAELQKVFEQLGVGDTGRIVIYGENSGLLAARVYFTLDYLGHGDRAALLDGGIEKWKAEKLPVETQAAKTEPAKFTPRPRPQIVTGLDAMRDLSRVAATADDAGVVIIDARPEEQYVGGQNQRGGHIPGAVNVYWLTHLLSKENPTMKPPSELSKIYEAAGLKAGQKAVTYCNTGMQASHAYFTLKYLGYDTMMYDGSFSEWSSAEGAQIVKGREKK